MRFCLLLFCLGVLQAVTIDRLAITVGQTVITELQIDEELRVSALLNGQPINRDLDARRAAGDRLVDQLLIQHEMELSHYPQPSDSEVGTYYDRVAQNLGGPDAMKRLLTQYDLTEPVLRAHLKALLASMQFIEFRFRPDVNITDDEIEQAYRHQGDGLAMKPADKARVSEMLISQRTDAALNSWLAESRKQVNIVYLDKDLR